MSHSSPSPLRPLEGLVVILVTTDGSENAGSVARLCGNFGCALRFVDVRARLDCHDARKMANPCIPLLDEAPRLLTLAEAIADCTMVVATSGKIAEAMDQDPLDVARAARLWPAPGERCAIVFGNERTGLSVEDAALCQRVVRLPTPGTAESFNLASAVAVTLTLFAEAGRQAAVPRASVETRGALLQTFEEKLLERGFYTGAAPAGCRPRLQELVNKMDLTTRDATLMADLLTALAAR